MINLLPADARQTMMYARRNTKLLFWSAGVLAGLGGVIIIAFFGLVYIKQNTRQINSQVERSKQELELQDLDATKKRAEEISNDFKLVTQVLSRQILFSEVLQQAGAVMPNGASLSGLSIEGFQGGIDLQVVATDYQTASQVQVNLADPANKLFQKVDIVNITCDQTTDPEYPCIGNYRALYAAKNPFLFLNSGVSP